MWTMDEMGEYVINIRCHFTGSFFSFSIHHTTVDGHKIRLKLVYLWSNQAEKATILEDIFLNKKIYLQEYTI